MLVSGQTTYEGYFKKGMKDGEGVLENREDGTQYTGRFRMNKQEGSGKLINFEENKVIYEGNWKYGQYNGKGKLYMK